MVLFGEDGLFSGKARALKRKRADLVAWAPASFAAFLYDGDSIDDFAKRFNDLADEAELNDRDREELAREACIVAMRKALEEELKTEVDANRERDRTMNSIKPLILDLRKLRDQYVM